MSSATYTHGHHDSVVSQHARRTADECAAGARRRARRPLGRGGVVGVRDSDYGAMVFTPTDARLDRFLALYREVARRNGGEPDAGRFVKAWLLEAGFEELEITTTTWT